jgi:hypothetical protein
MRFTEEIRSHVEIFDGEAYGRVQFSHSIESLEGDD